MNKEEFLKFVQNHCENNNIKFITNKDKNIKTIVANQPCLGFFEHNSQIQATLGIALDLSEEIFFEILAHEFSHSMQYLENSTYWTNSRLNSQEINKFSKILNKDVSNWETGDIIHFWIEKEIELELEELTNLIDRTVAVEYDAEKRTLNLIKELGLNINSFQYAKKANAYLATYYFALKTRTWTNPDKSIYLNESLFAKMPSFLDINFCKNLDGKLVNEIKNLCC